MALGIKQKDLQQVIRDAMDVHGEGRDALIPILHEINREYGFIPGEALGELRRMINDPDGGVFLADSQIFAIASFYHMFSLKQIGQHVIRYCESAPCHVMGGRKVIQAIQSHLGIQEGETTPDRKWTLLATSCLGVCGVGPVFIVDDDIYGNLTPERVPEILGRYS